MAKNKTLVDMAIYHLECEGYDYAAQAICRLRDENVRLKAMLASGVERGETQQEPEPGQTNEPNGVDIQEITHQDYWRAQLKGKPTDFAQNLIDQLTHRIKMARNRPDE
jgi:hypothetical protein